MSTTKPLLSRLGVQYPIIQAPMAGVATPAMAAAVSEAGGLGALGLGASSAAEGLAMMKATRALTSRPFLVNVFCHAPAQRDAGREAAWIAHMAPLFAGLGVPPPAALGELYRSFLEDDEAFAALLEVRPAVVSFHFGLPPAERVRELQRAGSLTLATATSLEEAERVAEAGIDGVVAQGIEAGGHRGIFDPQATDERLSMAVLVRQLVRGQRLPVIAAGGIMDGAGIRAALDLGAEAAQLGTAFILCPESAANADYRARLKSPAAASTRLTPVLSGRPARGMVNPLIQHGEQAGSPLPADYPVAYDLTRQLAAAAAAQGNGGMSAQWAGQGAPLARELPAAELLRTLVEEWRAGGA